MNIHPSFYLLNHGVDFWHQLFEKLYLSPQNKVSGDFRKRFANPTREYLRFPFPPVVEVEVKRGTARGRGQVVWSWLPGFSHTEGQRLTPLQLSLSSASSSVFLPYPATSWAGEEQEETAPPA